jgi:class 3 adenylate cyclase/tetratricopeptide (TPR) repeat protein
MSARNRADAVAPLDAGGGRFPPYVPRVLLRQLAESPGERVQLVEGTMVFADVSGFTRLSEALARKGREGAERLSDTISSCFSALLTIPYANGGSLIKFGGDAMLLLFEGEDHVARGCRAAAGMRRLLGTAGRIDRDGMKVTLRMSQGVHSGLFHFFLVGESHREYLVTGPGATEVVRMENAADAGEIVLSAATAERLPARSRGRSKGPGVLLRRAPPGPTSAPDEPSWRPAEEEVAACLSTAVREHVLAGVRAPEHRLVSVSFIHFDGTDEIVERDGPEAAAEALAELVVDVQRAADQHDVTFLGSDVDIDGGKLLLAAGAPRTIGDDEERMLLALRKVAEGQRRLPIHIGVARGTAFVADVGPDYRRTYTAMGDTTNLAARLMAKAPAGEIYATADLLEGSASRFETVALEPFMVKGKARPVQAWSVGPVVHAPSAGVEGQGVRLVGREPEQAILRQALASVLAGDGRLVELTGEPGIGKSRLLAALRELAGNVRVLRATCETYRASTPYSLWRELLRHAIDVGWEDPDVEVRSRLRDCVCAVDPALEAWLPLIAIAVDVEVPPTPEVEAIAPEFRNAALHEVVLRFLAGHLSRATLLEIENAHLMDEASADLLDAAVKALPGLPWLLAVTRREADAGFQPPDATQVLKLVLGPLSSEEAMELARDLTERFPLPPHMLIAAAERSGGNPQFLRDLLRAAQSEGADALPDSVEAAAMARIDRLAPADRELVRRASVLGASFHPRHLEDVLEDVARPDRSTWGRLSGIFDSDDHGHVRFARGVVHEAAYAGLPFSARRRLHRAAGERLELRLGANADEESGLLSVHFLLGGDDGRAWRYARIAGDRAGERFAWADSAKHYARALEAAGRLELTDDELADVWESLGEARARTGELTAATNAFTAARRLLAKDRLREAQLLHLHTLLAERSGRITATVRWARRGLRTLEGLDGRPALACRARLLAALATARQRQSRYEEAISLCELAISEATAAHEDPALAHACYILDWALVDAGRAAEAVHSPRALEIYERIGDLDRQAAVLNNLGAFAYHEGRWTDAVHLYERAAHASGRAGDVVNAAFGDCNVAEVRSDQGRLAEAEEALRRAMLVWRGTEHQSGVAFAAAQLGRVAVRGGRFEEGLEMLDDALALSQELHVDAYRTLIEALRAEAFAFGRRAEQALELASSLLDRVPGRTTPLLHRVQGFSLAQLGDLRGAEHALEESLAQARALKIEYEVAATLHALETLTVGNGGSDPRRAHERDALFARLDVIAVAQPPLEPAVLS